MSCQRGLWLGDVPPRFAEMLPGDSFPATTFTVVGATDMVEVAYDPNLGEKGLQCAEMLLAGVDMAYHAVQGFFGGTAEGHPVTASIMGLSDTHDGTGGAMHFGCTFDPGDGGAIYLDAAFDHPRVELALFIAELSECFQGEQNKGWHCGWSNGEALSRWHAELLTGGPLGAMRPWQTGPSWQAAGCPNFLNRNWQDDVHKPPIGCGMVYMYWMMRRQGRTPAEITQASGDTFLQNYMALTGRANAWLAFMGDVRKLKHRILSDDPW
jgi:hypothetical protein